MALSHPMRCRTILSQSDEPESCDSDYFINLVNAMRPPGQV
jgi:hypothetical protein